MCVGVRGRVINLTKVTQDRFRLAITLLMGRHMDSVVVDTEDTAKACIAHLKQARHAPLTFIPLDSVAAKPIDERLRRVGAAQLAIDILEFDRSLERAFAFICGCADRTPQTTCHCCDCDCAFASVCNA